MSLPSHASDGVAEARCLCQVMLVMVLPRRLGHGMMSLPSHAGNGAAKATWPWRNVSTESCWRWCCCGNLAAVRHRCRVIMAMTLPRQLDHGAMCLSNHARDGAAKAS
jgi:hypothetical protein